ncbi:hypothetical protein DP107_03025 [Haloglomus irregulare]|jgi:hypothetical protein|uniref:Uncharacterized protein n=1 Tax=Haloglomus irregulare TaxID=2234134 RepID=A0A554NFR9_9EURY|nr:hypothetical protein [Haloglomus irregulare]TSD16155.1 hypothetical protein DP107_03025 [Haloglomus irregulare]
MDISTSRRRLLTATATTALAATAGCARLAEFVASSIFKQVNVVNNSDQRVSGTVTVTDPAGEQVLDETFDLLTQEAAQNQTETNQTGTESGSAAARYDDVFTTTGEYEMAVSLDDSIEGVSEASETVSVSDTEDTSVAVFLGADDGEEPIVIGTLQGLGEIETTAN